MFLKTQARLKHGGNWVPVVDRLGDQKATGVSVCHLGLGFSNIERNLTQTSGLKIKKF